MHYIAETIIKREDHDTVPREWKSAAATNKVQQRQAHAWVRSSLNETEKQKKRPRSCSKKQSRGTQSQVDAGTETPTRRRTTCFSLETRPRSSPATASNSLCVARESSPKSSPPSASRTHRSRRLPPPTDVCIAAPLPESLCRHSLQLEIGVTLRLHAFLFCAEIGLLGLLSIRCTIPCIELFFSLLWSRERFVECGADYLASISPGERVSQGCNLLLTALEISAC